MIGVHLLLVVGLLVSCANAAAVVKRASPTTITLKSRKVHPNERLHRRAVSPTSIPLDDYFLGTDLQ